MRFIKLYEKMTDWEWYDDEVTFKVFIHLLLTANWKDTRWHGMTLKRGQRVISYQTLADEVRLTPKQVRTAITHLRETGEVTCKRITQGANKGQVITVENYEKYQGADETEGKQRANETANTRARPRANKGQDETVDIPTVTDDADSQEGKTEGKREGKREGNRYRTIELYKKNIPTVYKKDDCQLVVDIYNEECPSLPKCTKLSPTREKHIKARLKDHSIDELRLAFQKAEASDFCTGRDGKADKKWCSLTWMMKSEDNLLKVLEGNYDNRDGIRERTMQDLGEIGIEKDSFYEMERRFSR